MFVRLYVEKYGQIGDLPFNVNTSNVDKQNNGKPREWVINLEQVVYWIGSGECCILALSNGQGVYVKATDKLIAALTGASPHVMDGDLAVAKPEKS